MALLERLGTSWLSVGTMLVSAIGVYVAVIALTRLVGVRGLAKMSSFDFAATIAVGSTVSSAALGSTPLANGLVVLAMLFAMQYTVASLRRRGALGGAVDNRPLLLMAGSEVLNDNLDHARVSSGELFAALRQSGVTRREQVRAVVMETTGDMSVLTTDGPFDPELLRDVRGAEALQ